MDTVAYRRRLTLLETLGAWYDEETAEINQSLERLGRHCLAAFGQKLSVEFMQSVDLNSGREAKHVRSEDRCERRESI